MFIYDIDFSQRHLAALWHTDTKYTILNVDVEIIQCEYLDVCIDSANK